MTHLAHQPDHMNRIAYPDPIDALHDAQRVCDDLIEAITGRGELLVPVAHIEFLARRTRALVQACITVEEATYGREVTR